MKDLILQYENDFFSKAFCNVRENLENRLSKNFVEYGKSGLVHDRVRTINALHGLTEDRDIKISQFSLTILCENSLLARYVTHHRDSKTYVLRSSIWKFEDMTWQLFFHQGTAMNDEFAFMADKGSVNIC